MLPVCLLALPGCTPRSGGSPVSTSPATPERRYPYPALLPCGCPGECGCPRYALAAAGYFAGVAMVLMAPLFFTGPNPHAGPDLREVAKIGMGVFLVLASLHFLVTVLAVLAAAFADRS